MSLLRLSWWRH